jgi:hypothetical protein
LSGAVFIHRASTLSLKKNAVRVLFLDKADNPTPYDSRVLSTELILSNTKTVSKHGNLFITDTHGAGKAGTATPAPNAFETKAVFVPKIVSHQMMPLDY